MTIMEQMKKIQGQADDLQKLIDTPVPNAFELAMSKFPTSSTNNGRQIVKSKLEQMHNSPNDRLAKELDELGFSVDWDDRSEHLSELEKNYGTEN